MLKDLWELFYTFAKVGVMTFGGGYAMLPILQREVVEKKGWATDEELTDYFAIGQCTPGVIAVNTATFIGQKHRGVAGGIVATLGVVFPSLIIISALAKVITAYAHHGHVARLKGALDALGLNGSERLDIVLMQLVKLLRDGEVVRMSKRTGKAISLHDLLDEVSVDAARWYFNAKPDTQMEFDLGLAVREDSENPIYYVEYAHARICSLLRALETDGVTVPETADLSLLSGEAEKALIKQIAQYCEEIKLAARDYDPSHINRCLQELAACFHRFYTACRIRGEEPQVAAARLKLADDTRMVLKNGLKLIGVDAPEKM